MITQTDPVIELYIGGASLNQITAETGVSMSTAWRRVKRAGVNRSPSEGVRLAISQGRGAAKLRGRPMSLNPEQEERFREAAKAARLANARGWRITSQGYAEYTTGEHAGRGVHCVIMERRIGRRLLSDEVVHHIDGNKQNNDESNLALVTASGHARIHRIQEGERPRRGDGKFASSGEVS